jgi:hypothetical protein
MKLLTTLYLYNLDSDYFCYSLYKYYDQFQIGFLFKLIHLSYQKTFPIKRHNVASDINCYAECRFVSVIYKTLFTPTNLPAEILLIS